MATLTMTGIIKIAIATCNQGDNRPTPVYLRRSIDLGIAMTVRIALSCAKAANVAAKRSCPAPSHVDKPITEPESFKLHWLIEKHLKYVGRVRPSKKWRPCTPSEVGHIAVQQ